RSDIYSLSATLYQLLTNIVPEDAITRADAVISGKPDPIYPINTLNPEVSKVVSDVILKGMAISQEQRYVNARTMQKALREAYAQVQGEISAKTAAFKALNQLTVPQSQQATEIMPPVLSQNTNLSASETPSTPAISGLSSVPSPLQKRVQPEEDFDATIRIDSQPNDSLPKQSDIKTEVLITEISPEIISAKAEEFIPKENHAEDKNFSQAENFDRENDFAMAEDFGTNQNFSPGVTPPLISFDSRQAEKSVSADSAAAFDSATPMREGVSATTFVPTQKNLSSDEVRPRTPPNKSYGKTLAVGSGLGAFLILAIGGAYLAWYTLGGSGTTIINNTPSSSPQATVEVSTTPAPTLEAVTNSSNSGETDYVNSNTDVKIAEQTDDKTKPGTTAQPTPGKTVAPRPTPQVVTAKTPPPTQPVAKKTPAKGDRTDILQ
nr:hypothetical protein [Acidobacteriota bacterium]